MKGHLFKDLFNVDYDIKIANPVVKGHLFKDLFNSSPDDSTGNEL